MDKTSVLFSDYDVNRLMEAQELQMTQEIASYDEKNLLNTDPKDLADYFASKHHGDVPQLGEDVTTETNETKIDVSRDPQRHILDSGPCYVPGIRLVYHIPYVGDRLLFFTRANTFSLCPPSAYVGEDELQLVREAEQLGPDDVKSWYTATRREIEQNLGWLHETVDPFNARVGSLALRSIESRRKRLLDARNLTEALGFPVHQRDSGVSPSVSLTKRRISFRPPQASPGTYVPQPELAEKDFEDILHIISNMGLTMEKSPDAYENMKEEHLRSLFLAQLNGQYEGRASGETFNFKGKTDILVSEEGRNLFIAECKFWTGPASLTAALDQLLSYLCWRDTKAALIIFSKNREFSSILSQIPDLCKKHPQFKREEAQSSESNFRYVFHSPTDTNRNIHLAILAFNIPPVQRETR